MGQEARVLLSEQLLKAHDEKLLAHFSDQLSKAFTNGHALGYSAGYKDARHANPNYWVLFIAISGGIFWSQVLWWMLFKLVAFIAYLVSLF